MRPASIHLDFIPSGRRPGALALGLLILGALALGWGLWTYDRSSREVEGLGLRLAEATGSRSPGSATGNDRMVAEAQRVAAELQTPWNALLDDLEAATTAGKGDVVLISVEPDRLRQRLKLVAEARSLPAALKYVQRLQHKAALQDALLESHQVRTDVTERPVRVQIVAAWRMGK